MSLFQLGIITEHDMKVLELRSIEGQNIQSWSDEQVESIDVLIRRNGLSVCALSTPIFKCHLSQPEELQEHIAILHRSIEIAKRLGTSIIRGFSFAIRTFRRTANAPYGLCFLRR